MPVFSRVVIVLTAALAGGCATSLSSFRPAHVPRKGGVHAAIGVDVSVPTGSVGATIDAGKAAAKAAQSRSLQAEEQQQLIDAGIVLAANPPALQQTLLIAFAPVEKTEASLRYAGGTWRAGGRYQVVEQGDGHGFDFTAGFGVGRQSASFAISNVLDVVKLDDFVRWSFDVPLTFGRRGRWYRLWGGPRLMYTRGDTSLQLNLPSVGGSPAQTIDASAETSGLYWGGQLGVALGYRNVFFGFELTTVQFSGSARVQSNVGGTPSSRSVDASTFIVYPGLALMGEF